MSERYKVDWNKIRDEIALLAEENQKEALKLSLNSLNGVEKTYGDNSYEYAQLNHKIGILSMLQEDYDKAEAYLLRALDIGSLNDKFKSTSTEITKLLCILYEAKGRKKH